MDLCARRPASRRRDTTTGWFAYTPDCQGIHPQTHLAKFEGVQLADAYAGFNALFENGTIRARPLVDDLERWLRATLATLSRKSDSAASAPPRSTR